MPGGTLSVSVISITSRLDYVLYFLLQLPCTSNRTKSSLLISTNAQIGTLLTIKSGSSGTKGFSHDETSRIEWGSPVNSVQVQMPFLVSFETEGIEIHDVGSLTPLQYISLIGAVSMTLSGFSAGRNRVRGAGIFVATADQLNHYSMIPITQQVREISIRVIIVRTANLMCT